MMRNYLGMLMTMGRIMDGNKKGNVKEEHKDESRNEDNNDKNLSYIEKKEDPSNELQNKEEEDHSIVDNVDKNNAFDMSKKSRDKLSNENAKSQEIIEVKVDEKVKSKEKVDEEAKGEKSDAEEDLEWDEIEDIERHDEKKISTTHGGSLNKAELRNRLSIAEEDEDLSWDIEDDDDEPVKA
ncbi:unnamed protein product [Fraxinus pennsylvanica]|uniref:Uncharacterized protein n=1 Tax=Fraxinus pennsylvanica TaxID=56036 RepID=A0AAD1Z1Z7_9LAMI|nr:unnamed protein product [Fraxinus pennsylvanica]